jgi:hypothetical protein
MTDAITRYAEAAFAVIVTGCGLSPWPWTALLACGAYLIALGVIVDRRTPPPEAKA